MYVASTRNIEVSVTPRFLPERSSPQQGHFFWAYTIAITNTHGRVQEVRGAGVVGEQPRLGPGESFRYTSGVPLETPSGFMVGSYSMVTDSGERFDIAIPAFSLDSPDGGRTIN